ncbi:uncharacterized protein GGS22DRAFT_96027 [Annulohypoxylon maeteangense]|uniref:uncharacterized protein n=1 Tax=Annulohypoxylon maeteangense TaxID=1927788 RepID=UPI0020076A91|nr:uncharacterized protein GGS22DRAFT_96027 [Annulohypoxylon maeteangense]KAI0888323.1 hypothetical protein GGS22DRAFT_96027 [Annulohypoxylon maeteangense]
MNMSLTSSHVTFSIDWQAPAFSTLNFDPHNETICKAAGAWKAATLSVFQGNQNIITTNYVTDYLKAILPSNVTRPSDWVLIHWYNDYIIKEVITDDTNSTVPINGSLAEKFNAFPLVNCTTDICKNLDWIGDPDVSGRGMLITYYIAAGLVTIYLCALTLTDTGLFRQQFPTGSKRAWILAAIEESASTFLDATLIFAVSMLAAACFRLSQAYLQEFGHISGHWMIYASIGSIYMSTFSSLLPLLLQLSAHGVRHHWLRVVMWTLVILLGIANEILYDYFFGKVKFHLFSQLKDMLENIWLGVCSPLKLLNYGLDPTLRIAQILLVLNAFSYIIWMACKGRTANTQRSPRLRLFRQKAVRFIKILNMAVCCLLMWSMLGLFHIYRDKVNNTAGKDNQNSDWTFGQVLAVATWVPVLVEFVTVLKYGPEEGLGKKISRKYTIIPNNSFDYDHNKEDSQYLKVNPGHSNL